MMKFNDDFLTTISYIAASALIALFLLISGCGGGGGSGGTENSEALVANAGGDQVVDEQTNAILDGSGSTGNIASYNWSQFDGPAVIIDNSNAAIANYTAPAVATQTELGFRIAVSDSNGTKSIDEVTHTVLPVIVPPVADAGADQFSPAQILVTLDGRSSSDGDGNITSYEWTQIVGTVVFLNNANTATPSFTAPNVTELLTFKLTVTDDEGNTDSDEINVSVAQVLFFDDFSNGDQNGWTTNVVDDSNQTSAWEVNSGGYLIQKNSVQEVANGGTPFVESYHRGTYSFPNTGLGWADYRFSLHVTPLPDGQNGEPEGNDVGVMFRRQDDDNYYRFSLNARYGFSRLEKKVNGIFSTLAVDSAGYIDGEDVNIIVEVDGSLIQMYVDDEPLFSVSDPSISSGTIALYCQDRVLFDDVLVTDNSPAPTIVISSPVAYSIEVSDTLVVSANATNVPSGGMVEFVLDDSTAIVDLTSPFQVQFNTVLRGEHRLDAILRDASGLELAGDTNDRIGVLGDYYIGVGNSITNGIGDNYSSDNTSQDWRTIAIQGFESNLNDLLTSTLAYPHIVFNEGIGGDTAGVTANQRIDSILDRHPEANKVLVLLGTNDAGKGVSEATYKSNMQTLVNKVVLSGKDAWVALVPPFFQSDGEPNSVVNQRIIDYNDIIVSELFNIQIGPDFYDYFLGSGTNRSSLFADDLHPNGLGHAVMAYLWHNKLNPGNPLSLPLVLDELTNSTSSPLSYKQNLLEIGDKYYIDVSFTLTTIPSVLEGSVWIMTANADGSNTSANFISFEVDRSVTVYVAYDAGAGTLPSWLSSLFTYTGLQVGTTNGSLRLYSRTYPASSTIMLGGNRADGGNGNSNYVVIVKEN